jgi:hypothetical protein
MRKILTQPKYDGYKIKCGKCKCNFFAPFKDVSTTRCEDLEYVMCPNCTNKIYHSLFWKKCKKEDINK